MSDATEIPGSPMMHAIITPECRAGRTDGGAWDEAVARAKRQYEATVTAWSGRDEQPTLHLVLMIERPDRKTSWETSSDPRRLRR